ncbi:tachykinin-3 isoform 1-T1 [Ciconia maguari]
MRSRPALAALLVLALPFALGRRAPAAAAPPGPAPPAQGVPVPEPLPWSARGSPGAAYAALLQLLREEDAGEGWGGAAEGRPLRPVPARSGPRPAGAAHPLRSLPGPPAPPQKRKSRPLPVPVPQPGPAALTAGLSAGDMHDFFVGLMGKRAAEPGRPAGRGSGGPSPRCSPGPPAAGGAPLRAV